jgi:hypothetical protein
MAGPYILFVQGSQGLGGMGEHHRSFGEALFSRVRSRWFVYLAMSVFYCLDIYLTLLVLGSGFSKESNPVSRYVLSASGPGGWVAFRVIMLTMTTVALLSTFTLATISLRQAGRESTIDRVEEITVGSVMLFYAIAIVHNLVAIMAPLPRWT